MWHIGANSPFPCTSDSEGVRKSKKSTRAYIEYLTVATINFEGVKWGNLPLGAVSTDVLNGLSKRLNLVSQVCGATFKQLSV